MILCKPLQYDIFTACRHDIKKSNFLQNHIISLLVPQNISHIVHLKSYYAFENILFLMHLKSHRNTFSSADVRLVSEMRSRHGKEIQS